MPPAIDACLVFDDAAAHLELRKRQAAEALATLAAQNEIAFAGEVKGFTGRAELLWELDGLDPATHGRVLVISDLFADTPVQSGAIGARILRAIAQHSVWGPRTRRIVLTQHMVEPVLDGLFPYVHAYAAFKLSGSFGLAPAIFHAVHDADLEGPRPYPAARTPEDWHSELEAIVADLVGDPLAGDERVLIGLTRKRETTEINAELARAREEVQGQGDRRVRRRVIDFVKAVQKEQDLASPERAHELIRERGLRIAMQNVDDGLPWRECDAALGWRDRRLAALEASYGPAAAAVAAARARAAWLRETWLTGPEDDLTQAFLDLYRVRTEQLRSNAEEEKMAAIRAIKGTRREPGDPVYLDAERALGLTSVDLSYCIWTISDVRERR